MILRLLLCAQYTRETDGRTDIFIITETRFALAVLYGFNVPIKGLNEAAIGYRYRQPLLESNCGEYRRHPSHRLPSITPRTHFRHLVLDFILLVIVDFYRQIIKLVVKSCLIPAAEACRRVVTSSSSSSKSSSSAAAAAALE